MPGDTGKAPGDARSSGASAARYGRRTDTRTGPGPAHGFGILVVEDDEDSRDILTTFLEAKGFPVMTARHGQEALERLRDYAAPCMILLDLRMSVMDGWALRQALLGDPMLATIPVVVISAAENVAQAVAGLGVTRYFEKPFDFEALLRTVKQYC